MLPVPCEGAEEEARELSDVYASCRFARPDVSPNRISKNGSRYQITAVHVLAGISQDPFLRKTFAPHGLAAASAGPSPALALENSSSGSSPPLSSCLMWVPRFLTFFPALVSSNCGLMTFLYLRKASQSAC